MQSSAFHSSYYQIFLVSKSKCPGYVGLTGILLQEMKNVFKIITKANEIKRMFMILAFFI